MISTDNQHLSGLNKHVEQHGLDLASVLGNIQSQADDIAVRTANHMVGTVLRCGLNPGFFRRPECSHCQISRREWGEQFGLMNQAMHQLSGGLQALVPLVETSTTWAQSLLVSRGLGQSSREGSSTVHRGIHPGDRRALTHRLGAPCERTDICQRLAGVNRSVEKRDRIQVALAPVAVLW